MIRIGLEGLPSANTRLLAVSRKAQPSKLAKVVRSSSSLAACIARASARSAWLPMGSAGTGRARKVGPASPDRGGSMAVNRSIGSASSASSTPHSTCRRSSAKASSKQGSPETVPFYMRDEVLLAIVGGRTFGDPKQDERQAAALADQPAAFRHVVNDIDHMHDREAAAGGDDVEPDAEAGVAVLVAGFPVVAVVHTDDGQVRWILQRDRRQRADIHQQFAVAG